MRPMIPHVPSHRDTCHAGGRGPWPRWPPGGQGIPGRRVSVPFLVAFAAAEASTAPEDALVPWRQAVGSMSQAWLQALAARSVSPEELKRTKIGITVAWAARGILKMWSSVERQVEVCSVLPLGCILTTRSLMMVLEYVCHLVTHFVLLQLCDRSSRKRPPVSP